MPPQNPQPPSAPQPIPPTTNTPPSSPTGSATGLNPAPTAPTVPKPPNKKLIIGVVVSFVIGLLIIGVGYIFFRPGGIIEQQREAAKPKPQYERLATAYDAWRDRGVTDFASESRDATVEAVRELTREFSFRDLAITNDSVKQLFILSAAQEYAARRVDASVTRMKIYTVMQDDLVSVPNGITDENASMPEADQAKTIYDKYQDPELTSRVKSTIAARGLEAKARAALKLESGQTNSFDVYAMKFDVKSKDEESFKKDMLFTGVIPPLWVQTYPNTRFMAFTKAFASEFVLSSSAITEAYFIHEYSHTQRPLSRGDLGLLLEERKAEEVSGNKGAYFDVKQFFIYLNVATGYDALTAIQANPSNPEALYADLYKNLGVELADSVVASFPVSYTTDAATPIKTISARHNLEATLQLALTQAKERDPDGLRKRIAERGDRLIAVFGSRQKALDDLANNVAAKYQMKTMAEEMRRYLIGAQ